MRPTFSVIVAAVIFGLLTLPTNAQVKEPETGLAPALYQIQPGDKISLKFFSNPELNEPAIVVRPDGFISAQLIDDIKAGGRTVAELKKELELQYNEILLTPMISVSVIDFVQPRIYVGGQINKPGRYDLREAKTVVQAVFLAGGFTRDARRSMVIHARPDGKGDWKIQTANVMNILNQKGTDRDLTLQDGDYVFVPDSKMSQFNRAVEAFRGLLPSFL
ncbi:MAG: polysaccharide biosynthesis/export family protein [Acidobacteria bacterium]|nr:polysaccharide biosynthesis/export family protein [Acidobacteriota bacterium]MBK7931934.1 polysaccharide biosynthesis/export family protein [Acidobacteriota bacterium]